MSEEEALKDPRSQNSVSVDVCCGKRCTKLHLKFWWFKTLSAKHSQLRLFTCWYNLFIILCVFGVFRKWSVHCSANSDVKYSLLDETRATRGNRTVGPLSPLVVRRFGVWVETPVLFSWVSADSVVLSIIAATVLRTVVIIVLADNQ